MASRYELSDAQWERVKGFLPGRKEHVGRTAADNRVFVNGVLWVLRSGARWSDLPERYGKYKSVHKRIRTLGPFWCMGADLSRVGGGQEEPIPDDRLDAGPRPSAGGHGVEKRGSDKALGRSRGGLTTKVHLLVNELGLPLDFLITAGQVSDYTPAVELLAERQAEAVIADKGYDSDHIVEHVEQTMQAQAVIPPRSNRKQQRNYDKALYKLRNRIERCFSKLKHFRRFATRYEKSKACFKAMVALACSWIALNLIVDTA